MGNKKQDLCIHDNIDEAREKLKSIDKEEDWNYYIEEEVIYHGTQTDEVGRSINSAPTWRPLQA